MPTFEFFHQPMRYVTNNYLLHTRIYNIYIYLYFLISIHHILHVFVFADHSIKTLHRLAFSQCHMG